MQTVGNHKCCACGVHYKRLFVVASWVFCVAEEEIEILNINK